MARQRKAPAAGTGSDKPAGPKQPARRTAKKAAPRAAAKPQAAPSAKPRRTPKPAADGSRQPAKSAATPNRPLEPVTMLRHDEIAERAYFIWMKNGRSPGQEVQHWVEAENQLRQEHGAQPQTRG